MGSVRSRGLVRRFASRARVSLSFFCLALLAVMVVAGEPSVPPAADFSRAELYVDFSRATPIQTGRPGQLDVAPSDPWVDLTGQGPKTDDTRLSVLVYMQPQLPRNAAERAAVKGFTAQQGGLVKYEYEVVMPNVMNLRNLAPAAVEQIKRMPGVFKVELDEYHENVLAMHDSVPVIRGMQSQINGAGLSARGEGIRVCVCDTGIDSDHLLYANRIDTAAGRDFHNGDNNPEDDHGHGSHVAGTAVGGDGFSVNFGTCGPEPFQGVAVGATLIGVKILNQNGGGSDSNIIAGIDYCANQTASGGRADVINLSIGTGQFSSECTHSWAVACNNAVNNGVVVVAAAGNNGFSNALSSPACGANVIAVAATYDADFPNCQNSNSSFSWCLNFTCTNSCTNNNVRVDDHVCFSNRSTMLDVAAPGCDIWSASNAAGGTSIVNMCGTSMSCPHVAGLAALILGRDPSLTPAQVRQIIRDGAIDLGPAGFDTSFGYGRIDVINSLNLVGPQCINDSDCDDGDACNGQETCVSGVCQPGTPVNCDDGNACTTDSCDPASGLCSHVPINCDDGDPCTIDSCDPATGCQHVSVGCIDNDGCCPAGCDSSNDNDCPTNVCGNGICEEGENCNTCPEDCFSGSGAVCGNGICETANGENCVNCPQDCNGVQSGRPANRYCCGDGGGTNPVGCNDPRCTGSGNTCSNDPAVGSCCGDGLCEGSEDSFNCPIDCGAPPTCGDGVCDPGEDSCSCPEDCGAPPVNETSCTDGIDNNCNGLIDCDDPDCAGDPACQATGPVCGNGICEGNGEDCFTCPQDCRCAGGQNCNACCGDGVCAGPGESAGNCPVDCG